MKTVHDGFPLGEWLNRQRELAKKRSTPSPTQQTLTTIDRWWNPPWPILWQRAYHHVHAHPRHPPLAPTAATHLAPPPPTTTPRRCRDLQPMSRSALSRRLPRRGGHSSQRGSHGTAHGETCGRFSAQQYQGR
ncbi:hypothetical protein AB0O76_02630 [Streptomyces sp. NPDC086554]|uniref:hypothetical protein n=1 Tax=Streptomyces sp. NPDC086554 TaxID=3154864 RepID=UPI003424E74F